MIESFGDKETEKFYLTGKSKKVPSEIHKAALQKLDYLNAAYSIDDLKVPPGNRLEALTGKREGYWSIRINRQFRIVFRFTKGNAHDVAIVDYHK